MRKNLHELERAVEPLGFSYVGLDGADHHTFLNGDTGGVVKAANSAHTDVGMQVKRIRTAAKRNNATQRSMSADWINWLRHKYGIGATDRKEVTMVLGEEWSMFLADRHNGTRRGSRQLPFMALKASKDAEQLERGRGGHKGTTSPSVWAIQGPLYGVHTDTEEEVDDGVVDRVLHDDTGVADRGSDPVEDAPDEPDADGREREPEQSEPAPEPSAPRVDPFPLIPKVPGLTIPADLAAALQEALGGDLRAENELLRDALGQAHNALSAALSVVEQGLDLGDNANGAAAAFHAAHSVVPAVPPVEGLGRTRLHNLAALQAARDAGTLPDPFHTSQAEDVISAYCTNLGLPQRTKAATSASLHTFDTKGIIHRLRRGWFTWAA